MSKNNSGTGIHPKQPYGLRVFASKQTAHDNSRNNALEHIDQQSDQSGLYPVHAKCIGGPCVSAPMLSDVIMMKFPDKIAGLDRPERIRSEDKQYVPSQFFSPLSL